MSGPTYRATVESALSAGWRFAGLHASAGGALVRTALVDPGGSIRIETAAAEEGTVPTIVDLAPAAGWDEREAADLYGIRFDGHEPLRPLVDHDLDLDLKHWTVRVRGDDAYQIAVGPIHAGVIESGHFRFHVVGDRILHLDARLFYKHRGLERAAEGRPLEDGLAYAMRACAACAVSNTVAYAHACEDALGLQPTRQLARARTILLELERVWSHLNDIAAVCAGVGLAAGNTRLTALAEQARQLNERLTGHRFLFGSVRARRERARDRRRDRRCGAGRARRDCRRGEKRVARAALQLLLPGPTSRRRNGHGRDARTLGAVGPAARASGLADDVRTSSARLAYDGFAAVMPAKPTGDVQARLEQRALELWALVRPASRAAQRAARSRRRRTGHGNVHSASAGSRARAARRSASSNTPGAASSGCACAPAPTPTGPSSPTPPPATSCPTSR